MKILHVGRFDAAATAWHHRCALRAAGHESENVVQAKTYCADEADLVAAGDFQFQGDAVQAKLKWADVVVAHVSLGDHSSNAAYEAVDLHEEPGFLPHLDKMVLWADGSLAIRSNPEQYKARYADFRGVATNHDIADMLGFQWMPACIDATVDGGGRMWRHADCERATLAHPFSDAALKGASEARSAAEKAGWVYHEIAGVVRGRSLWLRGGWAAVFDHFRGYFGLTTMEASAMGQPCAVGYSDDAMRHLEAFGAGVPPWSRTRNAAALEAQLRAWSADWNAMEEQGRAARLWHEQKFSNALKVSRFLEWLG